MNFLLTYLGLHGSCASDTSLKCPEIPPELTNMSLSKHIRAYLIEVSEVPRHWVKIN